MKIKQIIWNNCEVMNMSNLAVLPIIIPFVAGVIVARVLSKIFILMNLATSLYVTYLVFSQDMIVLETGSWEAPYGIIFVADPLSILLVLTTNILSAACIFIAPRLVSDTKEKFYFYTFVFLLISG